MKNSYKIKTSLISVISISLVFVLLVSALAYLSEGFRDWNAKEWFKKNEPESMETNENFVFDEAGNIMESGKVHAMPANMLFSAAAPASVPAITLQATIKPDSAINKSVDWFAEWVDKDSEWATGKTVLNYLTVTPESDGSTIVNVSCLQAFGEQIKITVRSRANTDATANCTVDYAMRIVSSSFDLLRADNYSLSQSISAIEDIFTYKSHFMMGVIPPRCILDSAQLAPVKTFSDFTKSDTFTFKYYLTYSSQYINELVTQGLELTADALDEREIVALPNSIAFASQILSTELDLSVFPALADNPNFAVYSEYFAKLIAASEKLNTNPVALLRVVATGQYSTFTREIEVSLDVKDFADRLISVELNSDTLVI